MQLPVANHEFANLPSSHQSLASPLEIHLVDNSDIFYKKGRILSENTYRQVWNTEQLIDGNDQGIVIVCQGNIVGNMNLQLKTKNKLLKSETFFGVEHWKHYFDTYHSKTVEISGLAINKEVDYSMKQPIMMLLLFGAYSISRTLGIKFWTTIQRQALNRILTKKLDLPFLLNEIVTSPCGNLPNDKYWNNSEQPMIYYLDLLNFQTLKAFNSFLCYLNAIGVDLKFLSRYQQHHLSYREFLKNAYLEENCAFN